MREALSLTTLYLAIGAAIALNAAGLVLASCVMWEMVQ